MTLWRCLVLPIIVVDASGDVAEALVDAVSQIYLEAAVTAIAIGIGRLSLCILRVRTSIVCRRRSRRERSQSYNQAKHGDNNEQVKDESLPFCDTSAERHIYLYQYDPTARHRCPCNNTR